MDVLIRINGTQIVDEQEKNTIEMTTTGTMEPDKDGWRLRYCETEESGMVGTITELRVAPTRVVLERSGNSQSVLVLEKHRRHHSNYSTPYGMIDLGIYATTLDCHLSESGGTLDLAYTLGLNGSVNSTNTVHITVQEEKTPCSIS